MEADDPKAQLIALLFAHLSADKPHVGTATTAAEPATDSKLMASADLRSELSSMKLKALKKRAREMGVDEERLADADDADDIRGTVIELVVASANAKGDHDRAARQALESELAPMKLKALKKRARAAGVGEEQIDDADDADDIKGAVVELILTAELSAQDKTGNGAQGSGDKPHHGGGAARSKPPPKAERQVPTKHVMLSYQWDSQDLVKRAYDLLTALGVNCWMVRLSLLSPFHSRRPDPVSWLGRILWAAWRATSTAAWRRACPTHRAWYASCLRSIKRARTVVWSCSSQSSLECRFCP